jgi:urea carboxylase system permease
VTHGHAEYGQRRAGQVRLQAGTGPLAGALFLIRRRVQLHLDHDRGIRAVLFGFASGGPAFIWTWPAVLAGQMLVALCFAELAGQFPLAGSVYQWSKQIARPFTAWIGGWVLTVGAIVTLAAVAVAYQVVLPQISSGFQIIGGPADIGKVTTADGAKNALLLAAALVVFTTVINMVGVKTMARINNFGVAAELVGVSLLIILLAVHITRGPGITLQTFGTGAGHPWGYFGAFLVAGLMSAYVLYGFDTAGSLAEETHDPRRHAPPAILRALAAAGIAGFLVLLFALMSVPNIHAPEIATSGLPYIVKATFGGTIGNLFLIDSVIAITVCSLAVHAGGIRMIFTMGRDGRLPASSAIARVHGKSKTPLVPSIVIGIPPSGCCSSTSATSARSSCSPRSRSSCFTSPTCASPCRCCSPGCAGNGPHPATARTSRWAAGGCR